MSLSPIHDVQMALSKPDLSPLERVVYLHAVCNPGAYAVSALAKPNGVSDAAIAAAVKHLGKKGAIKKVRVLDGFVNLEPA